MWNEKSFEEIFPAFYLESYKDKQLTKKIFDYYVSIHTTLKNKLNDYDDFKEVKYDVRKYSFSKIEKKVWV